MTSHAPFPYASDSVLLDSFVLGRRAPHELSAGATETFLFDAVPLPPVRPLTGWHHSAPAAISSSGWRAACQNAWATAAAGVMATDGESVWESPAVRLPTHHALGDAAKAISAVARVTTRANISRETALTLEAQPASGTNATTGSGALQQSAASAAAGRSTAVLEVRRELPESATRGCVAFSRGPVLHCAVSSARAISGSLPPAAAVEGTPASWSVSAPHRYWDSCCVGVTHSVRSAGDARRPSVVAVRADRDGATALARWTSRRACGLWTADATAATSALTNPDCAFGRTQFAAVLTAQREPKFAMVRVSCTVPVTRRTVASVQCDPLRRVSMSVCHSPAAGAGADAVVGARLRLNCITWVGPSIELAALARTTVAQPRPFSSLAWRPWTAAKRAAPESDQPLPTPRPAVVRVTANPSARRAEASVEILPALAPGAWGAWFHKAVLGVSVARLGGDDSGGPRTAYGFFLRVQP